MLQLTMNKFADLTTEEFKERYLGLKFKPRSRNLRSTEFVHASVDLDTAPKSIDWREKTAVTGVKNQKSVSMQLLMHIPIC